MNNLEVFSLAWVFIFLGYMAYWDYKVRRIPNWLLVIASVPIPYVLWHIVSWVEGVFLVFFALGVLFFRYKKLWGMADSKVAIWFSLMLGVMPASIILVASSFFSLIQARKRETLSLPFVTYFFVGFVVIYGVVILYEFR